MRRLLILVGMILLALPAWAAGKGDAEAALASAVAVEARAQPGNRWVPTEAALAAARAAITRQAWDDAIAQANKARLLAERSIEQSLEQETAWHDAVIR